MVVRQATNRQMCEWLTDIYNEYDVELNVTKNRYNLISN